MDPVELLLVGCGMMGARHVRGLAELEGAAPGSVRLLAVCDLREETAQKVAAEAEELLGARPKVFASVEQALAGEPGLQAADLVTDPRSHDELALGLLEAGLHVICEKPLALTVARGRRMVEAARRTGRVLATAENNRRDPMNRLARACLEGGLIGEPNFALQVTVNRGGGILATAWRHRRAMGGVLLDVAIHLGYILEYLMGPIASVCARAQLVQAERSGKEFDGTPAEVMADAEDCFSAALEFGTGAQGQWTAHFASSGETSFKRLILGSEGTLDAPPDRSGRGVEVRRGDEKLSGEALLAELADYRLNEIETRLFGERPASYSFEGPVTDRKLIAAEMHDFVAAIRSGRGCGAGDRALARGGRPPEADSETGLRSVAVVHSVLESAHAGRPVMIDEVIGGDLHVYQDTVEAAPV